MKTIPNCYYDKALLKLIDNNISDGFKSYSSLEDIEKELIAAQCIEILGDDAYTCIIESENFYKTLNHFKKFLRTADQSESYDLVQSMIKNAVEYFTDVMDLLFDERLCEFDSETMCDEGFYLYQNINGETIRSKSL